MSYFSHFVRATAALLSSVCGRLRLAAVALLAALFVLSGTVQSASAAEQVGPRGSVSGHVFSDANGNGSQGSGELDLGGVSVTLKPVVGSIRTANTDGNGNFSFDNVATGTASVRVSEPNLGTLTTGNNPQTAGVLAGGTVATSPVGFRVRSNVVVVANATPKAAATTVASPTTTTTTTTTTLTTTTTTSAPNRLALNEASPKKAGPALIAIAPTTPSLPTASITASITPSTTFTPASTAPTTVPATVPVRSTKPGPGSEQDKPPVIKKTPNRLAQIDPTSKAGTSASKGAVVGHVFDDANGNATQDAGEPNLVGLVVIATGANKGTHTNVNGDFRINGLIAGAETLTISAPTFAEPTTGNAPQQISVVPANVTTATPVGFQIVGTITGHVFQDANGNTTQEPDEVNIGGLAVTVTDSRGKARSITTDGVGRYSMGQVALGPATVVAATPTTPFDFKSTTGNTSQTIAVIGGPVATSSVAFRIINSIKTYVFVDHNGDGTQQGGEPNAAGVAVTLVDAAGNNKSGVTDGNGSFLSSDVAPGNAVVTVEAPAGSRVSSGTNPLIVAAYGPTIAPAVGYQPNGSITGHVFNDVNSDGTQQEGEANLQGVSVVVTDSAGIISRHTTDEGGNYQALGITNGQASVTSDRGNATVTTGNGSQSVGVDGPSNAAPVGYHSSLPAAGDATIQSPPSVPVT